MTAFRLPSGGRIDRARPLRFTFDGRGFEGFEGDTLASALLAAGVGVQGRSFKYHRPRGPLTAGSAEPNALVTVGTGGRREPNVRATTLMLSDGLEAESQNRFPSLRLDLGAAAGLFAPLLGAGFYYKTFMWPAPFWEKVYEPLIRRAAGLGRAGTAPDPDAYAKRWAHCDLLVIGAGPAGLAAALTAAAAGAQVILADEGETPGGGLLDLRPGDGPDPAGMVAAAGPNLTVLPRATVFGWYDDNVFGVLETVGKRRAAPDPHQPAERLWRIAAREALLCAGADERPLMMPGNDLPGVALAGAMRRHLNRHAVAPGARVAVATNGPSGHALARDLGAAGVEVAELVTLDPAAPPGLAALGRGRVRAIELDGRRIEADALAMSGGWSPLIQLACQRGARPVWSAERGAFLAPDTPGLTPAGAARGLSGVDACLGDGAAAAVAALSRLGLRAEPAFPPAPEDCAPPAPLRPFRAPGKAGRAKTFVDFQNDVTLADLARAEAEGYGDPELAKRYTTAGMATDQGRSSGVNAALALAHLRGLAPGETPLTTMRPPFAPVSLGALAGPHRGAHFQPVRRTPLHAWAEARGAVFVETGQWLRPAWFPAQGETHWRESATREARAVRASAGLCDVSTLGKIEVTGADAAAFLDRVYCNGIASIRVGRARYALMLREDGMVLDDGTVARLAPDRFFVTTTTAMAGPALAHMEFCAQVLWPELDVLMTSVTDQWAQMAVAGPRAREILGRIVDADVSDEAFPYMAAAETTLFDGRIPARLYRLSYSGERAYELGVPAAWGPATADALMAAAGPGGLTPYGAEALAMLRIEKGHVTHAEINGTVTAADLGLGRMVRREKPDFIGRAGLARPGLAAADRLTLCGLVPLDAGAEIRAGAHVLNPGEAPSLAADQGHVTSATVSPALGHAAALALVKGGAGRIGEEVVAWDGLAGTSTPARIVSPVFLAPDGARLRAPAAEAGPPLPPPAALVPTPALAGAGTGRFGAPGAAGLRLTAEREGAVVQVFAAPGREGEAPLAASALPCPVRFAGPGRWLVFGGLAETPAGAARVDMSGAWVRIGLEGPAAAALLAAGTGARLDAEAFAEGASILTRWNRHALSLARLGETRWEIAVSRSRALDLWEALRAAGAEFGGEAVGP